MFDVCICCNNINERDNLNGFLIKFTSLHKFKYRLSSFTSIDDLLKNRPNNIDILFLNINLDNRNAPLIINKNIKALYRNAKIIFIPEIVNFMVNGFYLKDFKYIIKPVNYNMFSNELLDCISQYSENNILGGINPESILFIEESENKSTLHTIEGDFTINSTINKLSKQFDSYTFYKCHPKFLVNLRKVKKLNKSSLTVGTSVISISPDKLSDLNKRLLYMLNIKK